jgi:drug/metabolite transporter superfamily protein YnfA
VLLNKLGVVAAMLLALGSLAWAYGLTPLAVARMWPESSPTGRVLVTVLPVLGGVLLTPCLTLLTRSALAGCVFTIGLSMVMAIGSRAAVPWLYGDAATLAQASARFLDIFAHTMLAVVVLSALLMWRLFMRLEAIEGRGLELHLQAWLFKPVHLAAARSARSVWQQMLGKELHLQQLTFVVSGLYVAAWLAVMLVGESLFPTRRAGLMTVATLLHDLAIPLLAGSLASAEERQLGTLGWQVLLPIAAWRQWAVKAAVVLVLSLGLAIGVPAILYALFASGPGPVRLGWPPAAAIAAVATLSLYASSLSTNGVRALARVAPAIGGVMLVAHIAMNVITPGWMPPAWDLPNAAWAVLYAASAAVFALLLWLGMKNHRSAERGAKRVLKQLAALGAVVVVAVLAFAAANRAEVLVPGRAMFAAAVSLSRSAWRESGTAAARRNANTDELGGTR